MNVGCSLIEEAQSEGGGSLRMKVGSSLGGATLILLDTVRERSPSVCGRPE